MGTLLFAIVSCAIVALAGTALLNDRMQRLKRERAGENIDTFVQNLDVDNVPREVIDDVYRQLQQWVGDPEFPVRPDDSIHAVYGIVIEDRHDLINRLLDHYKPVGVTKEQIAAVETVGDLVRLFRRVEI
jgi:hypothetical protein